MQRWLITGLSVGMFTMVSTVSAQSPATKVAPSKGWLNDLSAGKALAAKTGKPMLVIFRCDP